MSDTNPAPAPHLEVQIGDDTRELFMSFGLLNEMVRLVGDMNRVAAIGLHPDLSDGILIACFAPRDAKGKIDVKDFVIPEMSPEAAEAVFDWVKEHVLGFFIRRLQKTLTLVEKNKTNLQAIGSSLAGSQNSASKTASSSPST